MLSLQQIKYMIKKLKTQSMREKKFKKKGKIIHVFTGGKLAITRAFYISYSLVAKLVPRAVERYLDLPEPRL